jgi:hypothetical protein
MCYQKQNQKQREQGDQIKNKIEGKGKRVANKPQLIANWKFKMEALAIGRSRWKEKVSGFCRRKYKNSKKKKKKTKKKKKLRK